MSVLYMSIFIVLVDYELPNRSCGLIFVTEMGASAVSSNSETVRSFQSLN